MKLQIPQSKDITINLIGESFKKIWNCKKLFVY